MALNDRQKKIAQLQSRADLLLFKEIERIEALIPDMGQVLASVRGEKGPKGDDGKDGRDGKDGYSPIKNLDYSDGEKGEPGKDGKDGRDGKDAVVDYDAIFSQVGKEVEDLRKEVSAKIKKDLPSEAELKKYIENRVKEIDVPSSIIAMSDTPDEYKPGHVLVSKKNSFGYVSVAELTKQTVAYGKGKSKDSYQIIDRDKDTFVRVSDSETGDTDKIEFFAGNTQIMTIQDDGDVGVGTTNPFATFDVASSKDPLSSLTTVDNYQMRVMRNVSGNGTGAGIAFTVSNDPDNVVGAAIVHERVGGNSRGKLRFYTKQSTSAGVAPVEFMRGNEDGSLTIANAYTLPTSDGAANQVLQTDGSGNVTFADAASGDSWRIIDADGDTSVRVADSESGDEDTITFTQGGTDVLEISTSTARFLNLSTTRSFSAFGSNGDPVFAMLALSGGAPFMQFGNTANSETATWRFVSNGSTPYLDMVVRDTTGAVITAYDASAVAGVSLAPETGHTFTLNNDIDYKVNVKGSISKWVVQDDGVDTVVFENGDFYIGSNVVYVDTGSGSFGVNKQPSSAYALDVDGDVIFNSNNNNAFFIRAPGGNISYQFSHNNNSALFDLKNSSGVTTFRLRSNGDSYFNGGRLGVGQTAPSAGVHITRTSEQLRVAYDATNYWKHTVDSQGALTLEGVGASADYHIDLSQATDGDFYINNNDFYVDTSTGYVGFGTIPTSNLHSVASESTASQSVNFAYLDYTVSGYGNTNARGLVAELDLAAASGTQTNAVALEGTAKITNSGGKVTNLTGLRGTAAINNPATMTNTKVYGLVGRSVVNHFPNLSGATLSGLVGQIEFNFNPTTSSSTDISAISTDLSLLRALVATDVSGLRITDASFTTGSTTNLYGLYVEDLSAGTNNYAIYTAGNTDSYFGGNIGVGTTSPSEKMHVIGNVLLSSSETDNTIKAAALLGSVYDIDEEPLRLFGYSATVAGNVVDFGGGSTSFNAATQLNFYTASSPTTTDGTERMRIWYNGGVAIGNTYFSSNPGTNNLILEGNMGIGTTSPDSLLHIVGTGSEGISMHVNNRIRLGSNGNSGGIWFGSGSDLFFGQIGTTAYGFYVGGGYQMNINTSGNTGFGISTTAADTRIEVNGAITIREKTSDPANPAEGKTAIWMSDGTGSGDDGDLMFKITAGGVTKTGTLVDFSAV